MSSFSKSCVCVWPLHGSTITSNVKVLLSRRHTDTQAVQWRELSTMIRKVGSTRETQSKASPPAFDVWRTSPEEVPSKAQTCEESKNLSRKCGLARGSRVWEDTLVSEGAGQPGCHLPSVDASGRTSGPFSNIHTWVSANVLNFITKTRSANGALFKWGKNRIFAMNEYESLQRSLGEYNDNGEKDNDQRQRGLGKCLWPFHCWPDWVLKGQSYSFTCYFNRNVSCSYSVIFLLSHGEVQWRTRQSTLSHYEVCVHTLICVRYYLCSGNRTW